MPAEKKEADGYFYSSNGEFLGKEGSSTKVFLAKSYEKTKDAKTDKVTIKYKETVDLDITHDDFCYIGGLIKHESGNNELNELKCIAFASYNESKFKKLTWKGIWKSGYSSVKNKNSHILKDNIESKTENQRKSNNSRKAMISVLTGEEDISFGAEFWDGTDFLAWGTDENVYWSSTVKGSNKFKEYKFIEISKSVYDKHLNANKNASTTYTVSAAHDTKKCSGSHTHHKGKNKKGEVIDKIKYPMPAAIFKNTKYWSASYFYYPTGAKVPFGLTATVAQGKSIFWKKVKERRSSEKEADPEIPGFVDGVGLSTIDRKSWILGDV